MPEEPKAHTETGVLRKNFGEQYRFWLWLRNQFTPASVSVIVSLVVGGAGYIAHLRESISSVTMRVVVLETRVIPVIDQSNKTAAMQVQINDTIRRVDRLEQNWDDAGDIASMPNEKLLGQKRRPR